MVDAAVAGVGELGDGQVLIAVEATPVNPSDLGVLLGPVSPQALAKEGDDLVAAVPPRALDLFRDRFGKIREQHREP